MPDKYLLCRIHGCDHEGKSPAPSSLKVGLCLIIFTITQSLDFNLINSEMPDLFQSAKADLLQNPNASDKILSRVDKNHRLNPRPLAMRHARSSGITAVDQSLGP